ncbi:MAG: N-acetylmuramoyl-L-alanine amidase [Akkermansiaceae bacterium]|nr:N-acetylmuramoyl-L-alanine amidase [Akkermansiaceae bacterium]
MRAIPILASLLLAAPFAAAAAPDSSSLEKRCAEQERQIRQLEEENGRLKSLVATSGKTTPVETPKNVEKSPAKAANENSRPAKITVRNGDTWVKVARRNDTTVEALTKLNKMKETTDLRAGQELLIPASRSAEIADAPAKEKESGGGTHVVKQGETFYSIAKRYGLGPEALQDANPKVKANALYPGLTLKIGAKTVVAKTDPDLKSASDSKDSDKKAPASKPLSRRTTEVAKNDSGSKSASSDTPSTKRQELAAKEPASDAEPASNSRSGGELVSTKPRVHTINIDDEISFGGFAQAHGTTPEKLNALNGLTLNSSTVLAKGSELRVPAQP